MRHLKRFIAALICLSIVMLCGCNGGEVGQSVTMSHGFNFPISLYNGIFVEDCYFYTGEYVEDASFKPCENVVALKVKNTSEVNVQLMRITVKTTVKEMCFELTTITPGSTVIALEKSRQTMAEHEKILSIECTNRVDFDKDLSLNEEIFLLQGNPKTINIKNISAADIESDIYVYYKKKDADGNYLGGITFRTKADGLKVDEIKQLAAGNFNPQDSEVLFVDYAN